MPTFTFNYPSIFIHAYIIVPSHSFFYTLLLYPAPPTGTNPQTGSALPSCSVFEKRHFYLFKIAIQGVSL
jgi:hypothetical protein